MNEVWMPAPWLAALTRAPATEAEHFYLWEFELLAGDGRPDDEPRDKKGSAR